MDHPERETEIELNRRRWIPAAIGFLVLSLGCIPIPFERTVVVRPEVEYRVEEAESGEPVEGVAIELCRIRIGPPPGARLDTWTRTTDADGRATFSYRQETESYQPLMMHGKAQRKWEHCLRAGEYAGYRRHSDDDNASATHLVTEEMSYEPEQLGKGLEPVRLEVRREDGEEIRTPDCPCDRYDRRTETGDTSETNSEDSR